MLTVTIDEALARLPQLIEAAAQGEHVLIVQAGKPAIQLLSLHTCTTARRPGAMKGRISIAEDFDSALPPILQSSFEH